MVEGARLERVYTGNRIEGSNPSLTAISQNFAPIRSLSQNCAEFPWGACGIPNYSTPIGDGLKFVGLRVGSIRQWDKLVPGDQYRSRSAQKGLA